MKLLRPRLLKKIVSSLMIVSIMTMGLQSTSYADVVTTEQLAESTAVEMKRNQVGTFLARSDVRQQLLNMGVAAQSVDQRIGSLTDAEVLKMHDRIEELPAGEGLLGGIIAIIVIFLLLDMAGVTDVFPRV